MENDGSKIGNNSRNKHARNQQHPRVGTLTQVDSTHLTLTLLSKRITKHTHATPSGNIRASALVLGMNQLVGSNVAANLVSRTSPHHLPIYSLSPLFISPNLLPLHYPSTIGLPQRHTSSNRIIKNTTPLPTTIPAHAPADRCLRESDAVRVGEMLMDNLNGAKSR